MDESQAASINDENCCILIPQPLGEGERDRDRIMENEKKNEQHDQNNKLAERLPLLKYAYRDDQWSPLNLSGKRVYDREFLIKLQSDPNSKIKPLNLPDLEVVLKDNSMNNRAPTEWGQFKDPSMGRHDNLFPGFVKSSQIARGSLAPKRSSQQGNPKSNKPAVIHVSSSLREDVKLRETENACKPGRMKPSEYNRGSIDLCPFEEVSIREFNPFLFPISGSVESSPSAREILPPKRGGQKCKSKSDNLIQASCSTEEDIELRKSENPWIPSGLKSDLTSQDNNSIDRLYKTVRRVLNKMMPETVSKLLNKVRALRIKSQEELQGVIDLVFNKAVDEPRFASLYALMCKELAMMQVSGPDSKANKEESSVNFRKLIITRCQMEFEKNTVDETAKAIKMQEIEACADPEKKKELQHILIEEERKIRIKSVGNIRFIGELFKQGMLTINIMHRCIRHLLTQTDEQSIECLCQLLSTIGKDLESKNQNLDPYFKQMQDIVNRKRSGKVGSRVRFLLLDVIELRLNKWIARDNSNLKTMGQIQEEAVMKSLDSYMNNTLLKMPRKVNRNSDNQQNRGVRPIEASGWSLPFRSLTQYSIETSELKNKPPPMDNLELDNKNMFQWSRNVSADAPKTLMPNKFDMMDNLPSEQDKCSGLQLFGRLKAIQDNFPLNDHPLFKPPPQAIKSNPPAAPASIPNKPAAIMTEEQLVKKAADILAEYLSDTNIDNAALEVRETFDNSTFVNFVREILNGVVEKSVTARKQVSQLMTHLISKNILPMSLYLVGLAEVTDMAEDLVIDIPKIWVYLAELILYPLAEGVVPFSELKTTMAPLKNKGLAGKLMGELMIMLVQEKGPKWVRDKWDQAGLEWGDFLREDESLNDFFRKYKLEFLYGDSNIDFGSLSGQLKLSMEQIHQRLLSRMSNEKENSLDNICSWISVNVGERASEPQFIRVLMTAILEVSIEPYNNTFKFKSDKFHNLQTLISRYSNVNEVLEIQCLIAIQEHVHKLEHPSGVLLQIIEKLWVDSILSYDAFLAWKSNKDPTAITGKSVAMMALTSFFTSLKGADHESSGEEA